MNWRVEFVGHREQHFNEVVGIDRTRPLARVDRLLHASTYRPQRVGNLPHATPPLPTRDRSRWAERMVIRLPVASLTAWITLRHASPLDHIAGGISLISTTRTTQSRPETLAV